MLLKGILISAIMIGLTGCATSGGDEGGYDSFKENVRETVTSVGEGLGSFFKGHETGTKITEEEMNSVKTMNDVVSKFGEPEIKEDYRGLAIYKYPYVYIPSFNTNNVNEYTIFEFDKSNNVLKSYKTSRSGTGIAAYDSGL